MRASGWTGPFGVWGATSREELDRRLPCDDHVADPDQTLLRAVDVDAPQPHVFRWLCQLRAAPYSYDWLDNRGRRSSRELTPGLERLAAGQRVLTIFTLAEFEPGRSITAVHDGRLFGRVAATYLVEPGRDAQSRIFVRLLVRYPADLKGALLSLLLPAGDLVMMRKQLLTLRRCALATA